MEESFDCQVWLERVPSQSNPADEPSMSGSAGQQEQIESGCHGGLGQGNQEHTIFKREKRR